MNPVVQYLPDSSVDVALDAEIRALLTACFTKPEDVVFRERRYFIEPYPHRWVIRDDHGKIISHVGVHERHIETGGIVYRVGGMAEVCVHPDYRGRGYVRTMLRRIHAWLPGEGFVFSVLFGDAAIYASSGYVQVANLSYGGAGEWKQAMAMVRELAHIPWPAGEVHLPGKKF